MSQAGSEPTIDGGATGSEADPGSNGQAPPSGGFGRGLIFLCQGLQSFVYGGIGLFLPLIRQDIGLSFTQAGTLPAVTILVYAFMQIPSGYLADRFGARRLYIVGLLGLSVVTLTLTTLHQYWSVIVNQSLFGVCRSLMFAPGLVLVGAMFPPQRRATAMGLFVASGFASYFLLDTLGPTAVALWGWRQLYVMLAGIGLLLAVAYWRLGPAPSLDTARGRPSLVDVGRLFRYRFMWMVAGIQFIRLAVVAGFTFWLPTLILQRGFSLQAVGLIMALGAALTAPANFLGGYLSDRLHRPLLITGGSLGILALVTFLLAWLTDPPVFVTIIALGSVFIQFYFGPIFAYPLQILGTRSAGVATGFGNFFANLGGFTFVFALGAVRDATGSFSGAFYGLAAICIIGVALTAILAFAPRRLLFPMSDSSAGPAAA